MIYFKIYFTLFFIVLAIACFSWLLMDGDTKRENLWFKISLISWITLFIMLIGGVLTSIWFFN